MIKNAIIYSVEMPTAIEMHEFAIKFMSNKPSKQSKSSMGFTFHPVTGDVVSSFEDGYCLTICLWEKKIDASALREEVKERVARLEASEGRPAKKSERDTIAQDITLEVLPHILPSPRYVYAYYHSGRDILVVDSAGQDIGDQVTALLRKAIGSLKATTVYVDNRIGLTNTFSACLASGQVTLTDGVGIGSRLEMEDMDGGKVKYTDIDLFDETTVEEICAQIRDGGMSVKSIELSNGDTEIQLTDGFKFKSIKYPSFEDADREYEHACEEWTTEAWYSLDQITAMSKRIVDRFTVVDK